jgi:hypothetical protein
MITLAVKIDWPLLISVILATCVLAWILISAINSSAHAAKEKEAREKQEPQPRPAPIQRTDSNGDLLRGLGLGLIVISLAFGAYTWLTFETTVETAMGKQVINFSLQHAQTLRLGVAALGVLCGVILAAVRR